MITSKDVRELLQRQPFRPFRLQMSNGEIFEVPHPELALVLKTTVIVAKPDPNETEPIGDGFKLLSILHINNIEVLPAKKNSKSQK